MGIEPQGRQCVSSEGDRGQHQKLNAELTFSHASIWIKITCTAIYIPYVRTLFVRFTSIVNRHFWMARARAGSGGICCTLEECHWDIWYYYSPGSLPSRSHPSQWKMGDFGALAPKRLLFQEGPESRFVEEEGSITIFTLNWQLVASLSTIQHVGNARKVLFPQHTINTKNYSKTKKSHSCFIGRHRRKKPQTFPALISLFISRCHFQTCSVIHCAVNLFVVFQLAHFLTPLPK